LSLASTNASTRKCLYSSVHPCECISCFDALFCISFLTPSLHPVLGLSKAHLFDTSSSSCNTRPCHWLLNLNNFSCSVCTLRYFLMSWFLVCFLISRKTSSLLIYELTAIDVATFEMLFIVLGWLITVFSNGEGSKSGL